MEEGQLTGLRGPQNNLDVTIFGIANRVFTIQYAGTDQFCMDNNDIVKNRA
jgi:hypothetical protein